DPLAGIAEFLAHEPVLAVIPQVARRTGSAGNAEVVAVLALPGDVQLFRFQLLQLTQVFLAAVRVEQGHLLIVKALIGQLPVTGRPDVPAAGALRAVDRSEERR